MPKELINNGKSQEFYELAVKSFKHRNQEVTDEDLATISDMLKNQ